MKDYDSLIIGHVTMDENTDHLGNTVRAPGGAVLFSSASAYALGHKVCALTKLAPEEGAARTDAFTIPREDIICLPAGRNTNMVNRYFTADKEKRSCVCASQGDPFLTSDIPSDITAKIYHLAGLAVGDYADDMIPFLDSKGDVAVDVQGYLRNVDPENGSLFFADWKEKKELLPFIRFLKTDAAEAEILTGETDRAAAAKKMHAWGAKEILITHNSEVLVFDGTEIHTCPIRSRTLVGRTGRGDTTFAAYINERLTNPVPEALRIATAAVSLKMESPGPLTCTRSDVLAYAETFFAQQKTR